MKGFQIISAGKDGKFGAFPNAPTDSTFPGFWKPGSGDWHPSGSGADDISSFNAGPLSAQN